MCGSWSPVRAALPARCSSPGCSQKAIACGPSGGTRAASARRSTRGRLAGGAGGSRQRRRSSSWSVGDAVSGDGLRRALEDIDVAYYLIHSMELTRPSDPAGEFAERERIAASNFAAAAGIADVGRIVYLGGLVPRALPGEPPVALSRHLAAAQGRGGAARRGAGHGRTARVDRDRRALALVSLSRATGRAHAGAGPTGVAEISHPADRRARCDRDARLGCERAGGGAHAGHGGTRRLTYEEMLRAIADEMLLGRPMMGIRVNLTRSPRVSLRRSVQRTRSSCSPSWRACRATCWRRRITPMRCCRCGCTHLHRR